MRCLITKSGTAVSASTWRRQSFATFDFKFHEEGINVNQRWYPLLQMEWVEGERLNEYVRRHLSEPDKLQRVAQRVLQMVRDLQSAGIAHGDLQHGNILVCNEDLRLVDYDGLWLPSLAGLPPSELGHPHYQHPDRLRGTATHFDGNLDNFSLWVIVLGLYALSVDPSLWEQTGWGDDWLLFRDEDFQPLGSPLVRRLEGHHDPNMRLWALGFRRLLFLGAERVPFPDTPILPSQPMPGAKSDGKAHWIRSHQVGTQGPTAEARPPGPDRTWLLDHRRAQQPGRLKNSVDAERMLLAASVVMAILLVPHRESHGDSEPARDPNQPSRGGRRILALATPR
jgi:serine/threonine protein kinase